MKQLFAFHSLMVLIIALFSMPALAQQALPTTKYKKALVIGAHPDDPETICGGTMLVLKEQGCEVVSVYLTSGEAGIAGKDAEESARIRNKEVNDACAVMGVRHIEMTQIDGKTEINADRYAEMKALIAREKPDVVFTHWPIDSHRDHRVCSILVYDAWRQLDHSFDLYYCEAMSGLQTQTFHPTDYVNIDKVVEQKHKACLCHVSQSMDWILDEWHIPMEKFRGLEFHCKAAEAFVKQIWTTSEIVNN
ncbi:MAG: PIG-L family deacetylase [Bacteroidales bacterium]|nr:PIG-L family deacetylase [Bacteroidales bacterium]